MQNGRRVVVPAVAEVIEDVPGRYSLAGCERSSTFYDSSARQLPS